MASFHVRSISLPSTSHPLTLTLEEQIHKLKISQSSLSIGQKLSGLKELYECVDDFFQLTLSHEKQNQSVEEALNGSLSLLDICSNTRDFFSQMRECLQGLELSLRRSRNGVDAYMASRKTLNKLISKYLKNLKKQDKNSKSNSDLVVLLKSVEEISVSMFESILSFISLPKSKSKLSIFTKILQPKNSSCEAEVEANEVEKIDAELCILKSSNDIDQSKNLLKELERLEMSLKEAEEELECVYRKLVKIRVSLLNSLNH